MLGCKNNEPKCFSVCVFDECSHPKASTQMLPRLIKIRVSEIFQTSQIFSVSMHFVEDAVCPPGLIRKIHMAPDVSVYSVHSDTFPRTKSNFTSSHLERA